MRIFDGKTYRDATDEEIAEFEKAVKEEEEEKKHREPSAEEIVSILTGESA